MLRGKETVRKHGGGEDAKRLVICAELVLYNIVYLIAMVVVIWG